jgi:hypothetical protein
MFAVAEINYLLLESIAIIIKTELDINKPELGFKTR